MENPIKMDDLGGKNPYFWLNIHKLRKDYIDEVGSLVREFHETSLVNFSLGQC